MEGGITPESDLFARKISVTWPDVASQKIPVKLQGDSASFQLCKEFNGSFNCFLNWRRAWVSTVDAFEGRKGRSK